MLTKEQKDNFLVCKRNYKLTEFEISIQQCNIELFKLYLDEISNIDMNKYTMNNDSLINLSLKQSSLKKDYTIPNLILNHKSFNINNNHNDPLSNACLLNDIHIFKLLESKGFEPNEKIIKYLDILFSKGITLNSLNRECFNLSFYLLNKAKQLSNNSLLLFHLLFLKQHIRRSESIYCKEDIDFFYKKIDALFIKVFQKGGYSKNIVWKQEKYNLNIIHFLVQYKEYKLLSYVLNRHPEDIYYYVKGQELYPLFYAIKETDLNLFNWLLKNTEVKKTKEDNGILPLSYIINIMEENKHSSIGIIQKIYNKKISILEEMFTILLNYGFSCHSSFREFSSAYTLLLLSQDLNKKLKMRLLEKIRKSYDFNINLIDSNKETVFSLIYENNDYSDMVKWLIKNNADINYDNISTLNKIIFKKYDIERLLLLIEIDNSTLYHKNNNETIYHTLLKTKHSDQTKYDLMNLFYQHKYNILLLDENSESCYTASKKYNQDNIFISCLRAFYQKENIKQHMKEKMTLSDKYKDNYNIKRL